MKENEGWSGREYINTLSDLIKITVACSFSHCYFYLSRCFFKVRILCEKRTLTTENTESTKYFKGFLRDLYGKKAFKKQSLMDLDPLLYGYKDPNIRRLVQPVHCA